MTNFKLESEKYGKEFLKLLEQWVSIPSVYDESTISEKAPFGSEIAKALNWFTDLGKKDGFITKNIDGYAAHIEYGEGDEYIYVFGHCDVVPPGEYWTSNPFKLLKKDDVLIGRGVVDDKGPVLASYLALKLINDNNIKLKRKVRIVAGGNEESGFKCIKHYFSKEPKPLYGFTPDAKFSVINGEKGAAIINISKKIDNDIVIIGGEVHNTIPNFVTIKGYDINIKDDYIKNFLSKEKLILEYVESEKSYKLVGIGGHSSKPEKSNNPIEKVLKLLSGIINEPWINELNCMFNGDNRNGELFGINIKGKCGNLILVPTIIAVENREMKLTLSVRYPENINVKEIENKIKSFHHMRGYDVEIKNIKRPNYIPEESILVKTLYDIYVKHTGDISNKVRITSAGTYAAMMNNSVIFGGEFPDGSSGNTHMADEYGSYDKFIKCIGIYAEALYALSYL